MSESVSQTLPRIIRDGWKQLANADQTEADEVAKILREALENLEAVECILK